MILLKLCRNILLRPLIALVLISSLIVPPAHSQETEDSQVFISGFNAYQQKDYASSIEMMSEVLQKYPDSPLRDMALFWLSRSYYKSGNLQEAARNLSIFTKEYPDNPLKSTVEDDLLNLVARYEKGEKLPTGSPLPKQSDRLAAQKAKAEKERVAAAKAAEARKAAEAAEAARVAAAKAEQEKIALAKAEEAKRAAAEEATRLAAVKAAEEKAAAEKREQERLAAVKAEQERLAKAEAERAKAEQERLTVAKAEEARKAAELAEQERLSTAKTAEAKRIADEAESARLAALKAEQEQRQAAAAAEAKRVAAAEAARLAAAKEAEEKAAADRKLASLKSDQERIAQEMAEREKAEKLRIAAIQAEDAREEAEKIEQERAALARAEEAKRAAEAEAAQRVALQKQAEARQEQERIAAAKAEQERIALETAAREKEEQQRLAQAKAEEARKAAEKAEQERVAAARLAEEQRQAARAEQERLAALKAEEALRAEAAAEAARVAARKAEEERIAQLKAEQERVAQAQAELARMNAIKAEEERIAAAERVERERIAQAKAEEARRAAAEAEAARMASLKAEQERLAAEQRAREEEQRRLAALKAEEAKLAAKKLADEQAMAAKLAYREKAIAQYKAVIDKFPATPQALSAATKLRELGVAVALPPVEPPLPENAQVLRLEVAQFAGFEFNMLARSDAFTVGKQITVPFEIINRGNGRDSFQLDSAFPAEFKARFAAAADPAAAISQTPELAPGDVFKGVISLTIPPASIDGLRIVHPVKASSRLMAEASQSREVQLVASAPLLRALLRTENAKPLPGDKVVYRIAVLNVGSTAAQDVTFRISYPPQLEPLDHAAAGFRQEQKSALVFDGLQVNSGESREFNVTFQLKDDSLAGQELSTRADLINNPLKTSSTFVSNVTYVEAQRSIVVRSGSERQMVIPGQTITVPFIVTNTGNIREKFKIASQVTGAQDAVIFNDLNRDGIRQASEPVITEIGPLAPREEASVVVEIKTPKSAADNSQGNVQISFISEGDTTRSASGATQLSYSRPVLKMLMAGRDGRLKPGDIASFDLNVTNHGSNLARIVELQSVWPEQLELVASEPGTSEIRNGTIIWRFKELGAGEKRTIKVSFKVKPGTGVGTAIQVKNLLSYEDQLGNRY